MKNKLYLSGSNGFIGSNILSQCLDNNLDVIEINFDVKTLTWTGLHNIKKNDIVIHAGASSSRFASDKDLVIKNTTSSYLLARIISESDAKLIYLSASSITPNLSYTPINSDSLVSPVDNYSWSKWSAELFFNEFLDPKNRILIRLPAIYCENLRGTGLLAKWLSQNRKKQSIEVFNKDSYLNCFYTRYDLNRFLINLILNFPLVKNVIYIGCNANNTVDEIANYFSRKIGGQIINLQNSSSGNYILDIKDALNLGLKDISVFDVIDTYLKE